MKWRALFGAKWNVRSAGALAITALGWLCLGLPIGDDLRNLSYELPFYFRSVGVRSEVDPVVILYLDDDSHRQLKQPWLQPWDRTFFADALERLTDLGARAVVFDLLLDVPQDPTTDQRLIQAAQRNGRTLFAAKVVPHIFEGVLIGYKLEQPFTNSLRSGVVEISSPDRTVRQHYRDTSSQLASLAAMTAQLTMTNPPADLSLARWVNYYGPPGCIPFDSFYRVISNALPAAVVSNKVVFIGARYSTGFTGGTGTDDFRTPYTRWSNAKSPGTEINATTFLNLWHGDWLTELPKPLALALITLCGLALGGGLSACRPWPAAGIALAAAALVAASAIASVWLTHHWFAWLMVCAVQVPAAFLWSLLANTSRLQVEASTLRKRLATAHGSSAVPSAGSAARPTPIPRPAELYAGAPPPVVAAPGAEGASNAVLPPIPDHALVRCIGQGAYGQVWLAQDAIGTFHAVKIVFQSTFRHLGPFERELRGLQKFTPISRSHPGFVNILHVGRNDEAGYFYCIMELGDDEATGQQIDPSRYAPKNLARELSRRGRFPAGECVHLGIALTHALDHLHKHHLIHRDIKPSNIIFVQGVPKFADVGLVTDMAETGQDVTYLGTHGYIAPEGPGTPGADVYSLGKVLYEASTGLDRSRFPDLPTALVDSSDSALLFQLNKIVLKACEPDPRKRYASAATMYDDLLHLQQHQIVQRRFWFWKSRRRGAAAQIIPQDPNPPSP